MTPAVADVDPWLVLDDLAAPTLADRRAAELLGPVAVDDPRRVAGLVSWLVRRAGLDGSTVLPVDVVAAALRAYDVADPAAGAELALAQGRVAAFPEDRLLGHPVAAAAEERIADVLVELVTAGSVAAGTDLSAADLATRAAASPLTVATLPRGETRGGVVRAVEYATSQQGARAESTSGVDVAGRRGQLERADVVVVDGAERLALADAAWLLERLIGGDLARLVLLGDADELDAATPGRFLGDVVACGGVPVCTVAGGRQTAPLEILGASLRTGRLPTLDPAARAVVVTPAADPVQALTRASQLATVSVPRVFGVEPAATRVATLRTGGACGVAALRAALSVTSVVAGASAVGGTRSGAGSGGSADGTGSEAGSGGSVDPDGPVVSVDTLEAVSARSCEALVLVLPAESAGSLTRAGLLSAAACATRHLSIVHQAGPALADAVARVPRARRRTRLAALLHDTLT